MTVADSEAQAVRLVEELGHVVVVGKLKTMRWLVTMPRARSARNWWMGRTDAVPAADPHHAAAMLVYAVGELATVVGMEHSNNSTAGYVS
ncbi:hypothetical protein [Streptomyces sp. RG80]|uniref:hypothetical protein n=1 Tax=Streptomyces sp. RG80 TaxID=3157340 RepID=UPI00339041FE